MSDTRTVAVKLRADTRTYQTSMKDAANQTTKFDAAQEKAQRNTQRWEAMGMAARVGGAAIAAGLLAATKAASNQEQAVGSLTATFKVNSAAMIANAKGATTIGLSIKDYSTAAARLGGQLLNLGLSQSEVAGVTDDLVRKAADLAAMFGGTTLEAVDALGAAMRGEADPAERYNLALQVTAVNAEMTATGANKAQAMLSLINKQMAQTGSIGAWNREIETAASQTQQAGAEFDNATAALGEALLPAMAAAGKAAKVFLNVFNAMPEPVKNMSTLVVALAAAGLLVGPSLAKAIGAIGTMKNRLVDIANPMSQANLSMGKMSKVAVAAGGALTVAATAFAVWANASANARAKAEELLGTLDETGRATDMTRQKLAEEILFNFDSSELEGTPFKLEEIAAAAAEGGPAFDELRARVAAYTEESKTGLGALNPFLVDNAEALLNTVDAAGRDAAAARALAGDQEKAADAAKGAADASLADAEAKKAEEEATKKAVEAYEDYIASVQEALGLLSARDALIGQEDRLAEAIKKNGNALKGRTAAAAANREAIAGEVSSIADLVDSTFKNVNAKKGETEALKRAEKVRKEQIETLKRSAAAAGYDRQEVNALIKRMGLLKPIETSVTVNGLAEALRQAKGLGSALGTIAGSVIPTRSGRAAGGYVTGPGSGTSDSIPANLSNGEYVLRASAVKRIGVDELDRMNYARGGRVGRGGDGNRGRGGFRGGDGGGGRAGRPGGGGSDMGFGKAVKAIERWQDKVAESKQKLADLKREAADYADTISSGILASSGGGLFDMFKKSDIEANAKKAADAADNVAAASRRLYDAQVKVNEAAPEERAAALKELADAQRDLASATGEQAKAQGEADAAAPTPTNIMGRMKARADAIENYAAKVKALMGKGLSMALIKELAGADMMEAGPVLDALLSMSPEALKELSSVDKRAKDAAASVGSAVSDSAFGGQIGQAEAELGVNTDGLKDAVKDAEKLYLDKGWRKIVAKAGLSVEERAQLMQSIRANDGKLTRHWRNVLAKAGLSAQEIAGFEDTIANADRKLEPFTNKERKAFLKALKDAGFDTNVDGADLDLENMTKKERRALMKALKDAGFDTSVFGAGKDLDDMTGKERKALMQAMKALGFDVEVDSAKSKADGFAGNRNAHMSASKEAGLDSKIEGPLGTVTSYTGDKEAKMKVAKEDGLDGKISGPLDSVTSYKGDKEAKMKVAKEDDLDGKIGKSLGGVLGFAVTHEAKLKLNPGTVVADARKTGASLGAALMAGIQVSTKKGKKTRKRQFSAESDDEESTVDTTLGASADDSIYTETEGASNVLREGWGNKKFRAKLGVKVADDYGDDVENLTRWTRAVWSDHKFKAKLGVKPADDFGSDVQSMKDAIAWGLNVPPVRMRVQLNTGHAAGGLIVGPGTGTSDSIMARLSNGEYVMRAASVAKYGQSMMDAINAGRFASGGPVGYRTTTAAPGGMSGGAVVTSVPVIVQIDGREIAKSQLKIERQSGGTITVGG